MPWNPEFSVPKQMETVPVTAVINKAKVFQGGLVAGAVRVAGGSRRARVEEDVVVHHSSLLVVLLTPAPPHKNTDGQRTNKTRVRREAFSSTQRTAQ